MSQPGDLQAGPEEAFVEVNGVRVHYWHAGTTTGTPMLLIHGLIGSGANWRNNMGALASSASVYAIDLLNMGKSERVEGLDTSLKAAANRVVAIMDALHIPAADIVAHSHGGAIALMLAAFHPERVRRLILFAPANPYNRASDVMVRVYSSRLGRVIARTLPYLPASLQRVALGEIYGGPDRVTETCLKEVSDGLRCSATLRHVLLIVRNWFSEMDRLKYALHHVAGIPTLLVWGDHDCTVSLASGLRLKRKLRGAKLVVMSGGGHTLFEERAEESNRIMLQWLARVPLPVGRAPISIPRRSARYVHRRQSSGSAFGGVAAEALAKGQMPRVQFP